MMDLFLRDWQAWARSGARALVVLAVATVLVSLLRSVAARATRLAGEERGALDERAKRAMTLASLLRAAGTSLILAVAGTMVLRELGIDITPIIAGAGVAGVAVGFGAQSLIKDVFAGLFILAEDQFRVGDVIRAAGVAGQVKRITLRVTVVRDADGVVHIIPNGEVKVVSNLSKGWSRVAVDVGVPYREDLDRVTKTLEDVARHLAADPVFGPSILEPPAVLGVESLGESRVTLRLAARTEPLAQEAVARELRRRIKTAFDRENIVIP